MVSASAPSVLSRPCLPSYFEDLTNQITFILKSVLNIVFVVPRSLPLASTRWVRLTFTSLCPLFKAEPSKNLRYIKFEKNKKMLRIKPGTVGWEA